MERGKTTGFDYKPLSSAGRPPAPTRDYSGLMPSAPSEPVEELSPRPKNDREILLSSDPIQAEPAPGPVTTPSSSQRARKSQRLDERDRTLLSSERWLAEGGHFATYIGLYLFTVMVFVRPYELVPGLGFLAFTAIYFALGTIILYVPSQLIIDGTLSVLSTEVKAILAMTAISIITMPIARDRAMAWDTFSDTYIKAVVIFIILVNVLKTRRRLMGIIWLSLGIGVFLAGETIRLYMNGEFSTEGYRVSIQQVKGIFGNPNEMAMHFIMMIPIAVALGIASKSLLRRMVFFGMAALFLAANLFTYSRGGFLGLIAVSAVLVWKLGRKNRLNVSVAAATFGGLFIALAPGNYGIRLLSIFIPSLDPVGSAGARREGLMTSILVTIRNPWGIGIGNSPVFGARNLQTHNAYTQVSAELGILGLIAYLVFMISPMRKLGAIERTLYKADDLNWFYYLSIGLQASIVGYMVTSFFASVAYNWFIYYLIAYAVSLRRIYIAEQCVAEDSATSGWRNKGAIPST
jgi:putative inorganic carbon (HCO3(-)) transporter